MASQNKKQKPVKSLAELHKVLAIDKMAEDVMKSTHVGQLALKAMGSAGGSVRHPNVPFPHTLRANDVHKALSKVADRVRVAQEAGFFGDDTPIEHTLFKVIELTQSLTMPEGIRIMLEQQHEVDDVIAAFRKLETLGLIEPMNGQKASEATTQFYSIVQGKTMDDINKEIPKQLKPIKQPETFVHNPDGVINKEEGLDRCIWKFMQDFKPHLLPDIGQALGACGFRPVDVKDRVIILLRKKWFNRTGSGKTTTYALKKHIKQPALEVPVVDVKAEFDASLSDLGRAVDNAKESAISPLATFIDKNIQDRREAKEKIMAENTKEEAQQELPIAPQLYPVRGEGIITSIWKLMSDYRPYQSSEIELLLGEIGIAAASVRSRLSDLAIKHNWFDRQKESARAPSIYTLRREIPMPVNEPPYYSRSDKPVEEPKAPENKRRTIVKPEKPVPAETTPQINAVVNGPVSEAANSQVLGRIKEDASAPDVNNHRRVTTASVGQAGVLDKLVNNERPHRHTPNRSMGENEMRVNLTAGAKEAIHLARVLNEEPVPLFERVTKISGVEFKEDEVEAVAKNLKDAGFGVGGSPAQDESGLIKFDIGVTIKGVRYSTDLANQLAETLFAHGYAKDVPA